MIDQHLQLNVQVMKMVDTIADLRVDDSIDQVIAKEREALRTFLEFENIPQSILRLLFHREVMLEESLSDLEVLELFVNHPKDSAAEKYGKMLLDFYGIEYFLRTKKEPEMPHYGSITKFDYQNAKTCEQLVYKSPYFRSMSNIKLENYQKSMDEALYRVFYPISQEAIGIDGIVGKVIIHNLFLDNLRVKIKADHLNVNAEKIVRDFYV
ncbi:MAG TPA: hypothetical protein VKY25_04585 [Erysipelothrix sp.]|nr:hypothetical protein [Erysipelothrix sp.]